MYDFEEFFIQCFIKYYKKKMAKAIEPSTCTRHGRVGSRPRRAEWVVAVIYCSICNRVLFVHV